ncbi:MAG: hypothetical protein PVH17_02965 [Anaerolineae bacterium]|jgi:hypothetical protein
MRRIEFFVPGEHAADQTFVEHLHWPIPAGVTQTYVEAYTEPGETVLLPYCQATVAIREILSIERRALAFNFDPLLVLLVKANLSPLPMQELNAAVARLGDSLKQGAPLRRYLSSLYATTCPACLRPAVADYFIWDREQGAPVAKQVRCQACDWDGRAAVDQEDRARLAETPAQGMHYHFLLDRVTPRPLAATLRARLEYLLELYTARNLYVLAELTLKIESIFPDELRQRALKTLLLDCLDRCSSLEPLPGRPARRRGLSRPRRFLERNVWYAFEEAITRFQSRASPAVSGLADTLEMFQSSRGEWVGYLGQGSVRDLRSSLSPRSLGLILASPPPLDSAAWSLSYLWGAWLLGAEAATPLRPLLRQRTPDPNWYARVMAGSLRTLAELLRDDGRLVLILTGQRPAVVEALVLAAAGARLGVASLVQRNADYRLELMPTLAQLTSVPDAPLDAQIQEAAVNALTGAIRARGEPIGWRTAHAAIQRRLAETGLLARVLEDKDAPPPLEHVADQVQAGLNDPGLLRLEGNELWWLTDTRDVALSLSDRVEADAYQVLQDTLALSEADFAAAVYARFPGLLTPDAELVAICLRTYGHEPTPGYWQLRKEDLPQARGAEQTIMREHLLALGRALDFQAEPWEPFDVAWFEGGQARSVFVVRWRAAVGEALALSDRVTAGQPYLVIPGGRAALVNYKLAHNLLWQQIVEEKGWRFIKYRHVRQLVAQPEVDEYALRTIIGLDPIVEQERAQIPLF